MDDPDALRAFVQEHPLATRVVADASGVTADPLPLRLLGDESSGSQLSGHVARANPLWKKAGDGIDCLAIFHGPQHYISPNWYAAQHDLS